MSSPRGRKDASAFEKEAKKAFPSDIRMISATRDSHTPVTAFARGELPDSLGKTGGSCTSALLQVLYREQQASSWSTVLESMTEVLQGRGLDQLPQLTSSRWIDVENKTMTIAPPSFSGTKRAILIGANYGQLSDCHDDVMHVKNFLIQNEGFDESNITVLMDKKGQPHYPTRHNILACFRRLVTQSISGDVAFVHFSGHSGRIYDKTIQDGSRYKETMIPTDFDKSGPILADELYKVLFCAMPAGVTMTVVMDCCHGGSIVDLPYHFTAGSSDTRMYYDDTFPISAIIGLAIIGAAVGVGASSGDGGGGGGDTAGVSGGDTGGDNALGEAGDDCCGGGDCCVCCEEFFAGLFA